MSPTRGRATGWIGKVHRLKSCDGADRGAFDPAQAEKPFHGRYAPERPSTCLTGHGIPRQPLRDSDTRSRVPLAQIEDTRPGGQSERHPRLGYLADRTIYPIYENHSVAS